jgi:hypothetical protein
MLVRDHYLRANNLEEDGRLIADLVPFNEAHRQDHPRRIAQASSSRMA